MGKKKAGQAKDLLTELSSVQEIKDTMEQEPKNWWFFLMPDIKRWENEEFIKINSNLAEDKQDAKCV